jgi:kinesin family protein C1
LSLDDQPPPDGSSGGQAACKADKQPRPGTSQSDVQTKGTTLTKVSQEEAARFTPFGPANSQGTVAPLPATTPQFNFNKAMEVVHTLLKSPCKNLSSPKKHSCLNKAPNLTSFTGWDVDGRLNEFESQFKVMKEAFEGTVTDRKAMEEAIDLAKNRGM